ncbi:adenylyl-sulfate kinase [Paucibacter soli]|uniref:adenylyl-sulfate kinase n=1 Tax=Paucibacter soli TaxID=3133433 RepID=UPI0030B7455D
MNDMVAVTLWLTGLSGSGKTTLAQAAHRALCQQGRLSFVLDGDVVRTGLCRDLGFSPSDRSENIRRVAEVARLMNEAGVTVICALISPLREDRALAGAVIGATRFYEVHVSTPLAVCEQRDPKGLYRRARAGEISEFTGISAPYEAPLTPALVLDTSALPMGAALERLLDLWRRA